MLISQDPNKDAWQEDGEEAGGVIMSRVPPKKKGGLIEARIGSMHRVSGKLGHYVTRDYDLFARRDGVKTRVVCISCNKHFESIDMMKKVHPTAETMRQSGDQHVWARWSEDALDPAQHEADMATYEERAAILAELSGATAYEAALKAHDGKGPKPSKPIPRILEIQAMLKEWGLPNAKALVKPAVQIIGLLSAQPMIDAGEAEVSLPGPDHALK
jgi:hypothetical protein